MGRLVTIALSGRFDGSVFDTYGRNHKTDTVVSY